MAYEVPPLPYDYAALEPHIDEATMKLHHDKHHQAYVTNLNGAVEKHPDLGNKSPEELLKDLASIPEDVRKVVQNNGGGHVNHTMFWQIMKPKGGGDPSGDIAAQIKADFGDFESFKSSSTKPPPQFGQAGAGSSSWRQAAIVTTANQDNPSPRTTPSWQRRLGARLLPRVQNRADTSPLQNTVNWDEVNKRFATAKAGQSKHQPGAHYDQNSGARSRAPEPL